MRKLIISALLIVVLVAATPLFMGFMAKKQLMRLAEHWSESTNTEVTVRDYQWGWLQSNAKIIIKYDYKSHEVFKRFLQRQRFNFDFNKVLDGELHQAISIHHGPVIFTKRGTFFGQAYVTSELNFLESFKSVFENQPTQPELIAYTLIKFNGGLRGVMRIPPYTYQLPQNAGTIQWKGFTGQWDFSRNFKKLSSHVEFGGVTTTVKDNKTNQTIQADAGGMTMTHQYSGRTPSQWQSDASLKFPFFTLKEAGKAFINLKDFQIKTQTAVKDDLLSAHMQATLGELKIQDKQYAPSALSTSIENLNATALRRISDQFESASNPKLAPTQRQMLLISLLPQLPTILDSGAAYKLKNLQVRVADGTIKASGQASVPKAANGQTQDIFKFKNRINVDFQVQIPKALMQSTLALLKARNLQQQEVAKALSAGHQQAQQAVQANAEENATQPQAPTYETKTPQEIQTLASTQAQSQLQTWITKGLLKPTGDNYQVHLEFKAGKLSLNGQSPF